MIKELHYKFVFRKRTKVLSGELLSLINSGINTLLDVGSGDGTISKLMMDSNPRIEISGIDIMARPNSCIPVELYNGEHIPYNDDSYDCCMFIDVLHHVIHIEKLLEEAKRVSRKYILVKDHLYKTEFDFKILKFMDKVGNKPHGVALEYNYLKEEEWETVFKNLGLKMVNKKTSLPLYPFPFNILFGRKLHFICLLEIVK
ncbi:MAG: class I SAM-dependent methyltransferase [Chitinophagaceae bacterium]|nr:class I SAM-dependent methyltransferase [Chitinophagaceae bacterium]